MALCMIVTTKAVIVLNREAPLVEDFGRAKYQLMVFEPVRIYQPSPIVALPRLESNPTGQLFLLSITVFRDKRVNVQFLQAYRRSSYVGSAPGCCMTQPLQIFVGMSQSCIML
jgi:hypothetical protein